MKQLVEKLNVHLVPIRVLPLVFYNNQIYCNVERARYTPPMRILMLATVCGCQIKNRLNVILLGEILKIEIVLSNYFDEDFDVDVVVLNSNNNFNIFDQNKKTVAQRNFTETLSVEKRSKKLFTFQISPRKTGAIPVEIVAIGPLGADAIQKVLHVKPEGVTQLKHEVILVHLDEQNSEQVTAIQLNIPETLVAQSEDINAVIFGDIFGAISKNFGKMVRMPFSSSEENTREMMTNAFLLKYLKVRM